MSAFQHLIEKHQETLEAAQKATKTREFWAHWPEAPSGKIYGETANADGELAFRRQLTKPFDRLLQTSALVWHGEEESPYGFPLGISYPVSSADHLVTHAHTAQQQWSALTSLERAAVLVECLEQASRHFFEIAYATQHTTGQGFVMSFQASGPHSFDRALESIATGLTALQCFDSAHEWVKPMGKMSVTLDKHYRVRPKGVNVTIGCSTFPVWNSVPGMFASLITGAATIAKAHTKVVYPIAIVVASMQQTLKDLGLNPHIVQLAVANQEHRITHDLIEHPLVGTVDYTGSSHFGTEVETICHRLHKVCYTEKAGVNCVIVESAPQLEPVLDNLAFSLSLYSGQMCTAPQNIYIPKSGVLDGDTTVSVDEFGARLAAKIRDIAHNEKMGPSTLGALQSQQTKDRVEAATALGLKQLLASEGISQPGHEHARSLSPLLLQADASQRDITSQEWFGPIAFVIPVDNVEAGLDAIAQSVRTQGALTVSCYSSSEDVMRLAEEKVMDAGCSIAFNFVGPIWVNQSSAYSDFHGAGSNPAGNASFADLSFISGRYNVLGSRRCKA